MERLLIGTKSSGPRCLKLVFRNRISLPVLNGDEIKGEGGKYLEVALVEDVTGNVVDFGREASAHVEIVALDGDSDHSDRGSWVTGKYRNKIPSVNDEKKPVPMEPVKLRLIKGIGSLEGVMFKNSSKHNRGMFRLGADVTDSFDGTIIKEAMTEPFEVQDYRKKYRAKHHPPSLSDDIWRLENIQKDGAIHKRAKEEVKTVEDFLIQLLKDPERLKRLLGLKGKKWEDTVDHARKCTINQKVYCCINSQENRGVVIDIVGKILGLTKDQNYVHYDTLSQEDKVEATKLFEQKEEIKDFDNQFSLLQYLSCPSTIGGSADQANIYASSQEAPLHDPICIDPSNMGTLCQEAGGTGLDPSDNPTACTGHEAPVHDHIWMDQSDINEMNLNTTSQEVRSKHPSGGSVSQEPGTFGFNGSCSHDIFTSRSSTGGIGSPILSPRNDEALLQEFFSSLDKIEPSKPHGFHFYEFRVGDNSLSSPDKFQFDSMWMDHDNAQPFSSSFFDKSNCPTQVHAGNSNSNNMSSEGGFIDCPGYAVKAASKGNHLKKKQKVS